MRRVLWQHVLLQHAEASKVSSAHGCWGVGAVCYDRAAVQIERHISNTETQGTDAQLESVVNRWGIKTLSALCELCDGVKHEGRIELVCAHALRLA